MNGVDADACEGNAIFCGHGEMRAQCNCECVRSASMKNTENATIR